MTIGIITDSTAYLDPQFARKHDIKIIPLTINFDDAGYQELVDLSSEDFYKKMQASPNLPSSSQPAYGQILAALEEGLKKYDQLLVINLSAGISGTCQSFQMAAKELNPEAIAVYDSSFACAPQANLVLEAVKYRDQGFDLDAIIEVLDEVKASSHALLSVSNLKNFTKSGRISNSSGLLGDLLKIRPVLEFQDGKIVMEDKVRTTKRVIHEFLEKLEQEYAHNKNLNVWVLDANDGQGEEAQMLMDSIRERFPEVDLNPGLIGPVIGVHTGPTVFALGWAKQTKV